MVYVYVHQVNTNGEYIINLPLAVNPTVLVVSVPVKADVDSSVRVAVDDSSEVLTVVSVLFVSLTGGSDSVRSVVPVDSLQCKTFV